MISRKQAKLLINSFKDSYGKPKQIMHKIDTIYDSLELEIVKRDMLIYAMMRNNFGYQSFMIDKSIDIDELSKRFETQNIDFNSRVTKERVQLLHPDIINETKK